jgi:MYXO-CTERM domain-containing protein
MVGRSSLRVATLLSFGLAVASWSGSAYAHIKLKAPKSRDPNTELKSPPCGPAVSKRSTNVAMFTPGQKIMVEWDETIQHPGHYRIAFDVDGQDFKDPTSFTDIATAGKDLGSGVTVLMDGIMDMTGRGAAYKVEITLPDVECETCTLQLIQVMTDKSPYGNGDDIYHECADLVLERAPGAAAGSGGSSAAGSGGAAGVAASSGAGAGGNTVSMGSGTAGSSAAGSATGAPIRAPVAGMVATAGSGLAGSTGTAGTPAPATAGGAAVAGAPSAGATSTDDGGCSVARLGEHGSSGRGAFVWLVGVAGLFVSRRRRRRGSE